MGSAVTDVQSLGPQARVGDVRQPTLAGRALPLAALGFAALALSVSAIFVRWAAIPGAASACWRMVLAVSVTTWPVSRAIRRAGALPRRHLALAALAGLLFAGDLTAWNSGVLVGSAANATLLANTSAIWVALGAVVLFRERLRTSFWAGLLLAMVGAGTIVGRDLGHDAPLAQGDLLGLLAGLFYGAFFLPSQRARERLGALVTWWIAAVASTVVLFGVSLALGQPLWGYGARSWLWLFAVALVTQVGGYVSINYALGHLRATLVAPVLLLQPVFTALLAWPLLGEPLVAMQVAGGLLVLAGIAIVHRAHS